MINAGQSALYPMLVVKFTLILSSDQSANEKKRRSNFHRDSLDSQYVLAFELDFERNSSQILFQDFIEIAMITK